MKVNIAGVGLIPTVGLLAPVYGKDLTKDIVSKIIANGSFKVYVATSGVLVTKKNIDEVYGAIVKTATVAPVPVVETKPFISEPTPVVPEKVFLMEEENIPIVEEATVEEIAVEEIVETVEETAVVSDIVEDEVVEEVAETAENNNNNYNKKKKKRH